MLQENYTIMHLLDDVCLLEGELWPRLLSVRSSTRAHGQPVMNSAILLKLSSMGHVPTVGNHRWQKSHGKIVTETQGNKDYDHLHAK